MLKPFFVLILFVFFPIIAHAAGADLKMSPSDIRFSKTTLISGDTVRIYTKIQNVGTGDVTGYVTFYQGSDVISEPQVISVVAGSSPEEAFVDFVVPTGAFNIRTVISGTKPADVNLDNNVAITGMITPVLDDDHDGVVNASDNCPAAHNPDQLDTDHDGLGNACDDDMDGDTLSNSVEAELGTNPLLKDTDGDGVDDAHDAYPLDPKRWILEKPAPVVTPIQKPAINSQPVLAIEKDAIKIASKQEVQTKSTDSTISIAGSLLPETQKESSSRITRVFSPNAVFTYEKSSWNTFSFHMTAPVQEKSVYEWNFGDGVRSSKTEVNHAYSHTGTFTVVLKTTNEKGETSEESADIRVAFFSFSNPIIIALLSILGISFVGLVGVFVKSKKKKGVNQKIVSESLTHIHVQEE